MNKPIRRSPMMTITRNGEFEMAHRLSCAQTVQCNETVHGHSYKWVLTLGGTIDPATGMLTDFKNMSRIMKQMEHTVDHALWIPECYSDMYSTDKKVLVSRLEPTAEVMAIIFCLTVCHELFSAHESSTIRLTTVKVAVFETSGNGVEVELNRDTYKEYMSEFPTLWVLPRGFQKFGVGG